MLYAKNFKAVGDKAMKLCAESRMADHKLLHQPGALAGRHAGAIHSHPSKSCLAGLPQKPFKS